MIRAIEVPKNSLKLKGKSPMKKKTVVLFLLASMLLNTFCACAETEDIKETEASQNTAETTETAETAAETEPPYYDTKGANYDGSNFGIWNYDNVIANGWAGIPYDLFTDEITGDTLNDAVYNRNLEIQNKLNITIIGTNSTANFAKDIAPLMAAGDTSVDLMFPAQVHVPSLVSQDSVYDILELESFDLSEPWWNQNCNETMTMKGKLFVAASDATNRSRKCDAAPSMKMLPSNPCERTLLKSSNACAVSPKSIFCVRRK